MKRRDFLHFLHGASWTTISWGLGQASSAQAAPEPRRIANSQLSSFRVGSQNRWQNTAAPTARKFALLLGLNHYADPDLSPLAGCLTDLKLQHQLLRHRYGFVDQDILTLADQTATVSNFQTAVTEHLINQVRPGDVVVCHFSGYGTLVDGKPALVLFDRPLPLTQWGEWMRSLPTPYITTILDTSFVPSPALGFLNNRSLPQSALTLKTQILKPQISSSSLLTPNKLVPNKLVPNKLVLDKSGINPSSQVIIPYPEDQDILPALPGVVIGANAPGQLTIEKSGNGFSAGLFTYVFTQQLWQTNPPTLQSHLGKISSSFKALDRPSPLPSPPPALDSKNNPPLFFLPPVMLPTAQGVVMETLENPNNTDNIVTLWLGGMLPQVLAGYGLNSLFRNADVTAPDTPILQIIERSGLQAKAKMLFSGDAASISPKSPPTGTLLRELVRVLPQQVSLQIAFDRQLSRVERVDATSAFASMSGISLGQDNADYLFTISDGSYGLSTLGGNMLPTTQGQPGEAAKSAVSRLKQQLQNLLAIKLLYLTENVGDYVGNYIGDTNNINQADPVDASQTQQPQIRITQNAQNPQQYLLENKSDRPLYGLIFCSTPELWVLSSGADFGDFVYELAPQANISIVIPEQLTNTNNNQSNHKSNNRNCHTYGIFSTRSLSQTSLILKAQSLESQAKLTFLRLSTPLAVIKAIYQDLQTPDPNAFPASSSDSYILEVNTWVTFWL